MLIECSIWFHGIWVLLRDGHSTVVHTLTHWDGGNALGQPTSCMSISLISELRPVMPPFMAQITTQML